MELLAEVSVAEDRLVFGRTWSGGQSSCRKTESKPSPQTLPRHPRSVTLVISILSD